MDKTQRQRKRHPDQIATPRVTKASVGLRELGDAGTPHQPSILSLCTLSLPLNLQPEEAIIPDE